MIVTIILILLGLLILNATCNGRGADSENLDFTAPLDTARRT